MIPDGQCLRRAFRLHRRKRDVPRIARPHRAVGDGSTPAATARRSDRIATERDLLPILHHAVDDERRLEIDLPLICPAGHAVGGAHSTPDRAVAWGGLPVEGGGKPAPPPP